MSAYTDRLRQIAEEEGMPWDVVSKVINAEGGMTDPYRQAEAILKKTGRREQSFGPLQLNIEGGVGEKAIKAGYDPRKDWENAYRYGLQHAKKYGWGDWMGARKLGLAGGSGHTGTYALKRKHLGGAGSKPNYFSDTEIEPDEPDADTDDTPRDPSVAGGKDKPKTWNEKLGSGLSDFADAMGDYKPIQTTGMAPVDFSGGSPMPSVYRPQLMPAQVQAGVGGMGGGQDMRQLLALLMQGGLG